MTRRHRSALAVVCLTLALAGGTAWWTAGAGAAGRAAPAPKKLEPYGVNFTFHTVVDKNFCLDDSVDGVGATGEIAQCASRDSQHFTFATTTTGTSIIVDSLGQCLGTPPKKTGPNQFTNCTFGGNERFTYNAYGQLQNTSGKLCLQAEEASQNASVLFEKCQADPPPSNSLQVWQLSH